MRTSVKYRLLFLLVAVLSYVTGSHLLPEQIQVQALSWQLLSANEAWQRLILVSVWFFVLLPVLYWSWVIKAGQQKVWKMLLVFSMSSLVARYQYPEQFAQYFEFITVLKYPFLAILVLLEMYLLVTIVKSLWQARSLTGDPRIHMLDKFQVNDEESELNKSKQESKLALALTLAYEPASWYYAIPRFSRNHVKNIANIQLGSAKFGFLLLLLTGLSLITVISYWLLVSWSETVALVVATFVFYTTIMLVANYRVSRHYSLYELDGKLVVNNSWWGFAVAELENIEDCQLIDDMVEGDKQSLFIGGKPANLKLKFTEPFKYFSGLAQMCDSFEEVYLQLDDPVKARQSILTAKKQKQIPETKQVA